MKFDFNIDPVKVAKDRKERLEQLLELTPDNCVDNKERWNRLSWDTRSLTDVKTEPDYIQRVYSYIYYMALNNTPVTLYSLNRIFNLGIGFKLASATNYLIEHGYIYTAHPPGSRKTVAIPTKYQAWVDEVYANDIPGKTEFMNSFLLRAT